MSLWWRKIENKIGLFDAIICYEHFQTRKTSYDNQYMVWFRLRFNLNQTELSLIDKIQLLAGNALRTARKQILEGCTPLSMRFSKVWNAPK